MVDLGLFGFDHWYVVGAGALVILLIALAVFCLVKRCKRSPTTTASDEEPSAVIMDDMSEMMSGSKEFSDDVLFQENPLSDEGTGAASSSLSVALNMRITLFDKRALERFSSGADITTIIRYPEREERMTEELAFIGRNAKKLPQSVAQPVVSATLNITERALVAYLASFESELARLAVNSDGESVWPPQIVSVMSICRSALQDSWNKANAKANADSFEDGLLALLTQEYKESVIQQHCQHRQPQVQDKLVEDASLLIEKAANLLCEEYAHVVFEYARLVDARLEECEEGAKAGVQEELDAAFPEFFVRYDLDHGGTLNEFEEIDHLCTNLIYSFGLYVTFPPPDEVRKACTELNLSDDNEWSLEQFVNWFNHCIRNRTTVKVVADPGDIYVPTNAPETEGQFDMVL